MANPAAFIVLCAYTCSILLQLPRVENWGSNAHSPHQIWPNAINLTAAKFRCGGWHTQHNTTASIVRNHLCFKPRLPSPTSYTMPPTSAPAPLPTFAKALGGSDMNSGFSVATSATGFTTDSDGVSQEDLALVAKLQQIPVHAPPGPRPTRAGLRPLMKTQLAVKRKSTKEAKAIATEERKSAMAARKADIFLKRQQQLINSAEVKAAKATAKANELCLQLAATASADAPPPAATSHSQKKSKGSSRASASTLVQSTPPSSLPRGR